MPPYAYRYRFLTGKPTTIHSDRIPLHVVSCLRSKENSSSLDILRCTPPTRWNTTKDLSAPLLIFTNLLGIVRRHIARGNRIDIDVMFRPLVRHSPSHSHNSTLARGVGRDPDSTLKAKHTRDIDDLSTSILFDELASYRLAEEEYRLAVDCHDIVPILLGIVDRIGSTDYSCIVHENIDMTEYGNSFGNDSIDWLYREKIFGDIQKFPPQLLDSLLCLRGVDIIDSHDIGTGFSKAETDSLAKTSATLAQISERLELPKSTAHRLLGVLLQRAFVRKTVESSRYRLGPGFIGLCSHYLNNLELKTESSPFMSELSKLTGNTVFIAIRQQDKMVYVDSEEQVNSLRKYSIIGQQKPLYCTSLGKALLMGLSDEEIRQVLSNVTFAKWGPNTHTNIESLLQDIRESRRRGWALDNQEAEPAINCVAAPIRDYRGQVIASISTTWILAQHPEIAPEQIAPLVMKAASGISTNMGYIGESVREQAPQSFS